MARATRDGVVPSGDFTESDKSNLNGSCVEVAVDREGRSVRLRNSYDAQERTMVFDTFT